MLPERGPRISLTFRHIFPHPLSPSPRARVLLQHRSKRSAAAHLWNRARWARHAQRRGLSYTWRGSRASARGIRAENHHSELMERPTEIGSMSCTFTASTPVSGVIELLLFVARARYCKSTCDRSVLHQRKDRLSRA